jgi:hypothetical protein
MCKGKNQMKNRWQFIVSAVAFLGCGTAKEDDSRLTPPASDDVLTDTAVILKADGTLETVVTEVTAQERREELVAMQKGVHRTSTERPPNAQSGGESAASAAPLLRTNRLCNDGADLWLYDAELNKLCIAHVYLGYNESDSLDLEKVRYGRGCYTIDCSSYPTWGGRVQSIWTGSNDGGLYSSTPWLVTPFAAREPAPRAIDPVSSKVVYFYGPRLN